MRRYAGRPVSWLAGRSAAVVLTVPAQAAHLPLFGQGHRASSAIARPPPDGLHPQRITRRSLMHERVSDGRLLRQRGAFNELRPAGSLAKRESAEARVFLTIDADKVLLL